MQILAVMMAAITLSFLLVGCNTYPETTLPYSELPADGDAVSGEKLFVQQIGVSPSCASCHNPDATASPHLEGFGELAGTRVEGETAHEYAFYSIVEPPRYLVEGYGNAMYNRYDENLDPQDIADLVAYLLSL